jgi:hypothetical protein
MAVLPSSVAETVDKAPKKLPMGVRTAETIYTELGMRSVDLKKQI